MSENTITAALRGMGYSKEVMTAHGFRAMVRTIMDEVLGNRRSIRQAAKIVDADQAPITARPTYLLGSPRCNGGQTSKRVARAVVDTALATRLLLGG